MFNIFKKDDDSLRENIRGCIDLMHTIIKAMETMSSNIAKVDNDWKLYTAGNTEALESIRNRLDQLESRKH